MPASGKTMFFVAAAILLISNSFSEIAARESTTRNCLDGQFYYPPRSECKNCSEISRIFYSSSQDWLNREISGNLQEVSIIGDDRGGKQKLSPIAGQDDVVLSKLINANLEDQELIDSSNQDSANNGDSSNSQDSAAAYYGDGSPDSSSIGLTKQTLKFVQQFARSNFIENELLGAIDQCKQFQNVSACQMWSNLCAMSMYSHSDISSGPSSDQKGSAKLNSQAKWQSWQNCKQFNIYSICNSLKEWFRSGKKQTQNSNGIISSAGNSIDSLQNIYATNDEQAIKIGGASLTFKFNQAIQFLAYKYAYNGKFLGIEQFGLVDMEKFCLLNSDHDIRSKLLNHNADLNYVRIGKSKQLAASQCKFSLNHLEFLSSKFINETIFYDLYVAYPLNGVMYVKSVPILNKNLLLNGRELNRRLQSQRDLSRFKLVHRFFIKSTIHLEDDDERPINVFIFAENVELEFKLKRQDKGVSLNSLLLTLDYNIIDKRDFSDYTTANNSNASPSFSTSILINQNLIDMQNYKKNLDLIMTISSILSSIWSLIKCYNLQKCYGIVKLELTSFILRFIIIACDTIANLFILITFIFLNYLYFMLRFQANSIQVLAPEEELEQAILMNLRLAFAFKIIGLAYKLYIHLNVDLFFIDWEKPKMLTSGQMLNYATSSSTSASNQTNSDKSPGEELDFSNKPYAPANQQSSFWRPYTVINKWLQMLTFRRQRLTLQLITFICAIEIIQWLNIKSVTTTSFLTGSDSSINWLVHYSSASAPTLIPRVSLTYRILILSIIYLAISFSQILYKKYFYEPMIKNCIHEFIDLCSVANVSLFAMLYPRYGYYIHGRNANGSGDCNIAEMSALLEREERDLCSKRGLSPQSDQQTFTIILPKIINDHYKKLLQRDDIFSNNQLGSSNHNNLMSSNSLFRPALNLTSLNSSSFTSNRAYIECLVAKNKAVNNFLINFLEHIYKDIDYTIRDQRKLESFLLDIDGLDEEQQQHHFNHFATANQQALNESKNTLHSVNNPGSPSALRASNLLDHHHQQQQQMIMLTKLTAAQNSTTLATFCNDNENSFTNLSWLGLEFDLISIELLSLLMLDICFHENKLPLIITVSLIWITYQAFKVIYMAYARNNLITKAMVDEKFLFR